MRLRDVSQVHQDIIEEIEDGDGIIDDHAMLDHGWSFFAQRVHPPGEVSRWVRAVRRQFSGV